MEVNRLNLLFCNHTICEKRSISGDKLHKTERPTFTPVNGTTLTADVSSYVRLQLTASVLFIFLPGTRNDSFVFTGIGGASSSKSSLDVDAQLWKRG